LDDDATRSKASRFARPEDIVSSLRRVTRTGHELVIEANEVLERELAMAVSISERIRDRTFTEEALNEARAGRLHARLRDDAHRALDVVADLGGVGASSAIRFIEQFAVEGRPPLGGDAGAASTSG